jgi:DNA gyrase subunit B
MNPEQLWSTSMNPESRRLRQITIEDAEKAAESVEICMSDDVSKRKEFIMQNL